MKFLLDTNAWLRLFNAPYKLNDSVRNVLNHEVVLGLSPFSVIEVAQKQSKKPILNLPLQKWLEISLPSGRIRLQPITAEIAMKSYNLGRHFHGDPADRVIAATSILCGLTLVTSDHKLIADPQINTLSTL